MERPALILYNKLSKNAGEDERDVLEQVAIVRRALKKLGFMVKTGQVGLDLDRTYRQLVKLQPLFVFNLVETLMNRGEFVYFPAALYQSLGIPYTGSPLISLFIAANKVRSKLEMRRLGIPTPEWMTLAELHKLRPEKTYLLKPIWEEGSLGLDEENLFSGGDKAFIRELAKKRSDYYFIEEFDLDNIDDYSYE